MSAIEFAPKCLSDLIEDPSVTEVLVNTCDEIWFERKGHLNRANDRFESGLQYRNFVETVLSESNNRLDQTQPVADGSWSGHRYSIVGPWISMGQYRFSLRKHPLHSWTLDQLCESGWCNENEKNQLVGLVQKKENILVIGVTGSGKTSILNSLMKQASDDTRWISIEDTPELKPPNSASLSLLTRPEIGQGLPAVTQTELLKYSLRLRPDRLVLGEIRGHEAKDFLMALSTGHSGSAASLHADDPWQALLRLEMLIQMAAPNWQLDSIRRLVKIGLHKIILTRKNPSGARVFSGCYSLAALEPSGFLLDRDF